jgi:hypothetical protein
MIMEKLISCCGLNCLTCEARVATLKNDDSLRKITADKWKVMYNAAELLPEAINCTGCREEGVKFQHCLECGIRNCVHSKGYETCADCPEIEKCEMLAPIHKYVPEALTNLRGLN